MTRRVVVAIGTAVAVVLVLTACAPRTVGVPRDGQRFEAVFDTVQNLEVGHAVRVADVRVGMVTGITLDGYRARVRMTIAPDVRVLEDTVASIDTTSLLGEHYVALVPPEGADAASPRLTAPAELATTAGPPDLEQVVERSLALVQAVATDDADALLQAAEEVVGGREEQLVALVDELTVVTGHYADRREQLGSVIDGLAATGSDWAANTDAAGALLDDVDEATAVLARQRERIVEGLRSLRRLTDAAEGSMLDGTRAEFEATLAELGPVVATFAEDTERVDELITQVLEFVGRIQQTVRDDELELYGRFTMIVPDATTGGRRP